MELIVVSMVNKEDAEIQWQSVGRTYDEAFDKFNAMLQAWKAEMFSDEELENADGIPCIFQLDGAWWQNPLPGASLSMGVANARLLDVTSQFAAWCAANMDAFATDVTVHELEI